MSDLATLIHASAHHLPMIDDKSVQCVVTSPPYFGLRKYDGVQDVEWGEVTYSPMAGLAPLTVPAMTCPLGNEPTIEAFIGHLILCAREWRRVLKDDGVMWVNLGDSYIGSAASGGKGHKNDGGIPYRVESVQAKKGLPAKNLMMIPARFALAMQADGWILRSEIIWHKPNPMPESVTGRPTKAHEQIYLLAKSERYFYDVDAVREPNKVGEAQERIPNRTLPQEGNPYRRGMVAASNGSNLGLNPLGRNLRSVWTIATQPFSGAHFAAFPEKLVEPMIKAGSRVGDTVLDPFNGSGTTGRVAIKLGRKYIGVDLAETYLDELSPQRLTVQMELA